jgi:hypothetical protein
MEKLDAELAEMEPAELARYFDYLDELRESGITNMFGARPYLANAFEMESKVAGAVLSAWMKTFDGKTDSCDRAAKALGKL